MKGRKAPERDNLEGGTSSDCSNGFGREHGPSEHQPAHLGIIVSFSYLPPVFRVLGCVGSPFDIILGLSVRNDLKC